jgi:quercetin dioxygenase-like cupin family protein
MRLLRWTRQSDGIRSINARQVSHRCGRGFDPHGHDYVEVFCVTSGRLRHTWNDETSILVPGDAVALTPGEWHEGVADGGTPA